MMLVYDGECPFCSLYVQYVRIRSAAGNLELINARDGGPMVEEIRLRKLDLNEGMVLIIDGQYHFGAECIHRLALMSTGTGWFNRLNAILFSSAFLSKIFYPWLRFGRNLTLKALGRSRIE